LLRGRNSVFVAGIVHECKTSPVVTTILMKELVIKYSEFLRGYILFLISVGDDFYLSA
jgi:hypothetical protein